MWLLFIYNYFQSKNFQQKKAEFVIPQTYLLKEKKIFPHFPTLLLDYVQQCRSQNQLKKLKF